LEARSCGGEARDARWLAPECIAAFPALEIAWRKTATLQQLREAIPSDHRYRWPIRDRSGIFSVVLDRSVEAFGVTVLKTPVRAPKATAFCERLIGAYGGSVRIGSFRSVRGTCERCFESGLNTTIGEGRTWALVRAFPIQCREELYLRKCTDTKSQAVWPLRRGRS